MNDQLLRDRLFEQEQRTPAFEEIFRKELRAMTERTLKPFERIMWLFSTFLGASFVPLFIYISVFGLHGVPLLIRVGVGSGAIFGALWTILGIRILRQGPINLTHHENLVQGITFGMVLFILVLVQVAAGQMHDKTAATFMVLNAAVYFMVFGIPALFVIRINHSESKLLERLIRVELELAELADTIRKSKSL